MSKIKSELTKDIMKAIHNNKNFKSSWKIDILEQDGVITLEGTVPSAEVKNLVEKITENQQGVNSVINNLDIDQSDESPIDELDIDTEIKNPTSQHISLGK